MNFSWLAHGAILCARFGDHKASTASVPHLWQCTARDELEWRVGPRCYSPLASASPTVDTFQVSAPLTATPLRHRPLVQSHLVTCDNAAPPRAGGTGLQWALASHWAGSPVEVPSLALLK